jgi:glyoxylase I family protein
MSERMPEVIGIDHIYIAVTALDVSERFYDLVMIDALSCKKNRFAIGGDPHIQYFNRHFGFVLRPARSAAKHDAYAPGLHHLCLRVNSIEDVETAARHLELSGIRATPTQLYPEYAPDYAATFFEDPDGLRLEITNYRAERRERHDRWDAV